MTDLEPLGTAFFARPAEAVAEALLGTWIVSTIDDETAIGRIVETEAYVGPHDPASHAAARTGRTRRNATMFGPPGLAYVYRSYGIHWCLNVVTDEADYPAAVLIRAVEPVHGLDVMRRRRWGARGPQPDEALASGPGRLTVALGITGAHDAHPLQRPPLILTPGTPPRASEIERGPRVGISRATDWPLRFILATSRHLSRRPAPRASTPRRR